MIRIIIIFLLFAVIHSVTVTRWFKDFCRRSFGDTFMRVWYRVLYAGVSVVTAGIALYFMNRVPDRLIWDAPFWLGAAMRIIQLAGFLFGLMAFQQVSGAEFLGVRQVLRYVSHREIAGNGEGLTGNGLVTNGVYGIVRHPLYLAGMILFTFNPHSTVNGLTITVLADLYFLFGAFIEERRFLVLFGEEYREYMRRVPRLIPRLGFGKRRE